MPRTFKSYLYKPHLVAAIKQTVDDACEEIDFPWIGDETYEIMADAAIAVLRGMFDGEKYMRDDGVLRDGIRS